jgi:hypothetical protein
MTKRPSLRVVRRELKWIVDAAEAARVERQIEARVPLRTWFATRDFIVRSTYLDYADLALTTRFLAQEDASIRVRYKRYQDPKLGDRTADVSVWLEKKERSGDFVTKERVKVPGAILPEILDGREPAPAAFQELVARGPLSPIAGVSYRRVAFEEADESLRVTIDRDLAIVRPGGWRSLGTEVARPGFCIVEVKPTAALPAWVGEIVGAPSVRFSKFELAAEALGIGRR